MKIKHLLLSAFAAMFSIGGMAQSVPTHEMYVQYGQPDNIVAVLASRQKARRFTAMRTSLSRVYLLKTVSFPETMQMTI